MPVEELGTSLLAIALTLPRIGAAFVVLPLLTQDSVPALVRNSLFVALAIVIYPLTVTAATVTSLNPVDWPFILLKEMFIGIALGLLFGSVFWAVEMAGGIIDTQMGINMANTVDPIQGHQTSPTAGWLSRFSAWLLMASGGFLIFLDLLFTSYQLWPVHQYLPSLKPAGAEIFINEFGYIMTTSLLIAAPAVLLLALVDFAFGLINRYAQQLNVSSLSSTVKAWVGTWVMLLTLGLIVEIISRKIAANQGLLNLLRNLF